MIELAKDIDYVYMMLIAAGVGAIGGLGAELLLQRADNTGTIEIPGRLKGTRFVDIGFPASLIVGAIAAVAILYFFPPVVEKITVRSGAPPGTTYEYDLVRLVALALIVGSAGPAFLSTAQSRVMSTLNAQKADTAVETGKTQVDQVAESAKAAVSGAVHEAVSHGIPDVEADTVSRVAQAVTSSVENTLEPQVKVARDQMDAIAQTPTSTAESRSAR